MLRLDVEHTMTRCWCSQTFFGTFNEVLDLVSTCLTEMTMVVMGTVVIVMMMSVRLHIIYSSNRQR